MKKSILFLVLMSIALIFIAPQVNASDRDVGKTLVLPADNTVTTVIDCQAVMNFSPMYVVQVELWDPGDMCSEAEGIFNMPLAPPSGYFYDILIDYSNRSCTGLATNTIRCVHKAAVVSTSNGGAGY